jgi:WD40 repeat protein
MIFGVAFSPDGSRIVTACDDNTASLWNARTYEPIGKPLEHEGHVGSVSFSPDGTMVLTGSADTTARLWDVATSKPIGVPLRHESPVNAAAYCPTGKKIATACADGRVYLWDPPSDPLAGDVEQTVLWTQVVTGQELDEDGAIRNLDTEIWIRRRQRLHELGGPPGW